MNTAASQRSMDGLTEKLLPELAEMGEEMVANIARTELGANLRLNSGALLTEALEWILRAKVAISTPHKLGKLDVVSTSLDQMIIFILTGKWPDKWRYESSSNVTVYFLQQLYSLYNLGKPSVKEAMEPVMTFFKALHFKDPDSSEFVAWFEETYYFNPWECFDVEDAKPNKSPFKEAFQGIPPHIERSNFAASQFDNDDYDCWYGMGC